MTLELLAGQSYGRRLDRVVWRIHHDAFRSQWTRMINAALALLILILGLVGPATAAELTMPVAAAHRGEYATALRRLSPLAEKAMRAPSSISDSCTPTDGVCRENLRRRSHGIARPQTRDFRSRSTFLAMVHVNGEGVRRMMRKRRDGSPGPPRRDLPRLNSCSSDEPGRQGRPKDQVQGYAFMVMGGREGSGSAARVGQSLALTEAQRGQAQEIIDRWKQSLNHLAASQTRDPKNCSASIGISERSWIHRAGRPRPSRRCRWPFQHRRLVTGTLVCPRVVLTARDCLLNGHRADQFRDVHFLAG